MDARCTLTERKSGFAILKLDGTITMEKQVGKVTGTVHIDEKTGWTKSGNLTITMSRLNMEKFKVTFGDIELK